MATVPSATNDSLRRDSAHAQDHQWQTQAFTKIQASEDTADATSPDATRSQRKRKAKRKDESLSALVRSGIITHQLGLSINCMLLLALTHVFFPTLRQSTTPFFSFSYYIPQTGLYNPGLQDMKLIATWIVVFTGLRAATMDYVLKPFARWVGLTKKKTVIRYAEQSWLLLYYIVFWSTGMVLYYQSPYWANLPALWEDFPARSMTGTFKFYYLAQFAFWIQQLLVIHIEEKRKDHWQMFTHHIITSFLMLWSYGMYQTRVGNVILCLMDVVDLVFPLAKMFRYSGHQTICDYVFGLFMVTWFAARHVLYLTICWSAWFQSPVTLIPGCYDVSTKERLSADGGDDILANVLHAYRSDDSPVCFNERIRVAFLGLLLALQVLTLIWFGMICRIAYGVLCGKPVEDSRSEDEGDEEEEVDESVSQTKTRPVATTILGNGHVRDFAEKDPEAQQQHSYEEEVGVEDLHFMKQHQPAKRSKARSKGRSSGISIPGHGDHKELLGRIGCDKPS